jgi:hypothetical protein
MAWRLQQISSGEAGAEDLTDEEMLAILLSARDHTRRPFDESNPLFCAYLKIAAVARRLWAQPTHANTKEALTEAGLAFDQS